MPDETKGNKKEPTLINKLAKFSGLAIQMGVVIGAGAFLGQYLDEKSTREFPLWTIVCSLLAVGLALYYALKQIISND